MICSVYEPYAYRDGEEYNPTTVNIANIVEIEKYEYHKYWRDIGNFTMVIPAAANGADCIRPDMILLVDDGNTSDSLIITEVENDGTRIKLSGTDLKGLLSYRVTLFPQEEIEAGTYGYDARQGSTGSIIAGYLDYNCINPNDFGRKIPAFQLGNVHGGLVDDTYMSRLQPLNEVVTALCKNADIGWDISFSPIYFYGGYTFNIVEGSNRTNSGDRKCIFADYLHNAEAITKQEKTAERRNVIWTVNGGDSDQAVVTSIYKEDASIASGFNRRETVLTANCDLDLTESYVDSRTVDMVDKLQVGFKLIDPNMYGNAFNVGDKITVFKGGTGYDRRVIEAYKSYTANERSISVQLGDIPSKKYFEKTSADLSSRTDDVKELALENAATKKSISDNTYQTYYSDIDPTSIPGNNVSVRDRWVKLSGNSTITEVYEYVIMDDASSSENESEGDETDAG